MDLWLYVYGNGDFIYVILTSVNFFMNHAKSFFQLAAMISLLLFAAESTGVLPTKGYDWSRFIKMYLLLSIFVLTPYPGKVNIHDVITNQDRVFNFKDGKLPIGMIFPIAVTSTVMYRLINLYQQNFEIDENLNYTYSGMNFGANFIQALDSVDSQDPNFDYNVDQYMQNCGFPLLNKAGALSELRSSKNIFATLANYTSAARFVQQVDFVEGKTVIVKSCSQAITEINAYYATNEDKILRANAQLMGNSSGTAYDRYLQSANATSATLLGISQGASAALKQAIGMNIIMSSLKNGAQSVGNGSLALAAYDAEQFQQYKTTSVLSGAASARTVPILVGIAFALLFFLYPIMIFLAISAGSYKAIGVFFQIVITINLIPLIYEILNYITTFYLEKKIGGVITGQGFNYDVSTTLYSFTDNMIVAGNYLATATPMLAYAIVTGSSNALTSVFGHINDPAKQQAGNVGTDMARGNQNMGNATLDSHSFNNVQGNKLDNQLATTSGTPMMKQVTPGGFETNFNDKTYHINSASQLLAQPNITEMASHSLENSLRSSHEQMSQQSKGWSGQQQKIHDLSNNLSSGTNSSNSVGTDESQKISRAQELATRIHGGLEASAKLPFGLGGASMGAGMSSSSTSSLQKDLGEFKKLSTDLTTSNNQSVREAFSDSSSLTDSTMNTVQNSVSSSKALNDVKSFSSSITGNASNDVVKYMADHGVSDPKTLGVGEQMEWSQRYVDEKVNEKLGIKPNLQNPAASAPNLSRPTIDASNLTNPISSNNVEAGAHRNTVQESINDFNNHKGKIVGNQIAEQVSAVGSVGGDIMDSLKKGTSAIAGATGKASSNVVEDGKNIVKDLHMPSLKKKQY